MTDGTVGLNSVPPTRVVTSSCCLLSQQHCIGDVLLGNAASVA